MLVSTCLTAAEICDSFTGDLSEWTVSRNAEKWVRIVDGVLRLDGTGRSVGLALRGSEWRNFVLQFRMRIVRHADGDCHTGVRMREDPQNRGGLMQVFFRPAKAAFTGSGRTEAQVGPTPGYSASEWHTYRMTAEAGSIELEIDERAVGTVHGVHNEVGGISFYAYNCVVECDDVVLTPLAVEKAAPRPSWPVDLPPRPVGRPPILESLPASVPVTLYADSPGLGSWPVIIRPEEVGIPASANPTSLTLLRPDGTPCPTQFDDLDGDGRVSAPDEIVALVELDAGQVRTFRLAYTTDRSGFGLRSHPGFSVILGDDGFPRVTGPVYELKWSMHGAFSFRPQEVKPTVIGSHHGKEDQLVLRRMGPLRATVIVGREVQDNGRFTRRMDAYPTHFEMTSTLEAVDRARRAFVKPMRSLHLDLHGFGRVSAVWQRGVEGYVTDTEAEGPPVKQWFPARHGSLAYDFLHPECNVLVAHGQSPDWSPGLGLVGKHCYMAQRIAFGWRPPLPILPEIPHVQTVWITAHEKDAAQFARLDRRLRGGIRVLNPERSAEHCRAIARRAELLSQAFADLPSVPDSASAAASQAAKETVELREAERVDARQVTLALRAKLALEGLAAGGLAAAIREALAVQIAGLPTHREVAPARSLLLKAQACAGQAKPDLRLEHATRGAERLARAASFVREAHEYLRRAPRPVLPSVEPAPIFPYVTLSSGASRRQAEAGFDVCHLWIPWGAHFEDQEVEPENGVWRYHLLDKQFKDATDAGMRSVPLISYAPPRWYKKRYSSAKPAPDAPPGSSGDTRLVDPNLLDRVPPHMVDFADYITTVAQRHGSDPSVLAWSVRNEPAYYERNGINGEWMMRAFRTWLRRRYPNVADLNARWGTQFAELDAIEPPKKWADNKAAWYDLMTFKAECLAGELKWEADLITAHSKMKFTGAKFVPSCLGPHSARSGFGVDPWVCARVQQGVALVDMYLDGLDAAALRTAEAHWAAGAVPVISCETGRVTKPAERPFRWHYYPDRMASAYAWVMYQYGMYGVHYWVWTGSEEYGALDWDGSSSNFALEAGLANQEFRAARGLLSNLRPVADVGFFYPRATFVQGGHQEIEAYHNLYHALDRLGYHLRIVSHHDPKRWRDAVPTVVVPPAPYLERSAAAALRAFAEKGGHVVFAGALPYADEYLRACQADTLALVGARAGEPVKGTDVLIRLGKESIRVPNRPAWTRPELQGAEAVAWFEDGSPAIVRHKLERGDVTWIPSGMPSGPTQVLVAALRSLGVGPRIEGRVPDLLAHVLAGAGMECLVATNVGRRRLEAQLSVASQPGLAAGSRLLDLLTGNTVRCRGQAGRLVVALSLPPAETVVLPLLPLPRDLPE